VNQAQSWIPSGLYQFRRSENPLWSDWAARRVLRSAQPFQRCWQPLWPVWRLPDRTNGCVHDAYSPLTFDSRFLQTLLVWFVTLYSERASLMNRQSRCLSVRIAAQALRRVRYFVRIVAGSRAHHPFPRSRVLPPENARSVSRESNRKPQDARIAAAKSEDFKIACAARAAPK
jgi:hypothetical protein